MTDALRVHALRLTGGQDLKDALQRFTAERAIGAGFILSAVGGLSGARLRAPGEPVAYLSYEEPLEMVALGGSLSPDGLHLHIALSRRDGTCVGGHLVSGCIVATTAEVVIGEATALRFTRPFDPDTGYRELAIAAGSD